MAKMTGISDERRATTEPHRQTRLSGKETPLPATDARWPAADFTKSPHTKPRAALSAGNLRFREIYHTRALKQPDTGQLADNGFR
jgi:hypothetical protein